MSRWRWVLVVVVAVVALGGVALWANLNVAPTPSGYSSATENVQFYPACGNESLTAGRTTWYPVERDDWPAPSVQAAAASGGRGIAAGVHRVAAPGPGDDVGTLYVYPGGRAYWVSESGNLDTWLTVVPQTYNWVC